MNIQYNKDTKNFTIDLNDPRFGTGTQSFTYEVNCCTKSITQEFAPLIKSIKIPKTFLPGAILVASYTINGIVFSCTTNTCANTQTALTAAFPGARVNFYEDTEFHYINIYNILPTTTVTCSASVGGITVTPTIISYPASYVIEGMGEQGIHSFTVTKQVGAELISESGCYFVDDTISCVIADYVAMEEHSNTDVHLLYNLIKESVACNCNCKDLCKVFRQILLELNLLDRCKIC